jgi:4-amino-4-deoxy-L-arabinose transferase-like glycosyltransferase
VSPILPAVTRSPAWRPWSRGDALAGTALGVGLLASLPLCVHPWYDPLNDAATYILVARSLANGEGYTLLGDPFVLRPPAFPALLSLVIRRAGTGFAAMNLLVSAFGVAGALLLFVFLRPRLGGLLALLCALGVWFSPGYQRLRNQVMSDVPATALLLLSLVLERWAERAPSWRREVVLGAAVGAAAHVRTMLVLLLPAILCARAWQHLASERSTRPAWRAFLAGRCAIVALSAVLLLLPWSLYSALRAPPPPADQTHAYSYATGMWHRDQGDPASPRIGARDLLERLPRQGRRIAAALGSGLQGDAWSRPHAAAGVALVACLAVVLLRRREPAEAFALTVLALLAVYFGFGPRLVLPVWVLALPAAVLVLRDVALRVAGGRAAWVAPAAVALLVACEFAPRRGWAEIEARHRELVERAAAVSARLPEQARPGSAIATHYAVLLGRPVWSLEFAVRRAGLPDGAEATIDKYGLDTIVLSPDEPAEAALIPYFRERYGEGEPAGSARLFRVRPAPGREPQPHSR